METQKTKTKTGRLLLLVFISTVIAEVLSGSTTLSRIQFLPVQFLLYGSGAVFIREISKRINAGWLTIVLLGLAFGLALECFRREGLNLKCGLAVVAAAIVVCGIAVNVSRAAQVVAALELVSLTLVLRSPSSNANNPTSKGSTHDQHRSRRSWKTAAATSLVVILMTMAVVFAGGQSLRRWESLPAALQLNGSRPLLWRVSWGMAKDAGFWGDGPGTFKVLFPRSPHMLPELYGKYIVHDYQPGQPVSMWNHAHNDYLQTVIEWGWVGATLWAALMLGTLYMLMRTAFASSSTADLRIRILTRSAAIALLGVLVHAWVDFPLQVEAIQFYIAALFALAWAAPEWSSPAMRVTRSTVQTDAADRLPPRIRSALAGG